MLNEAYEEIAVIKNFSSLQWSPSYYEFGTFALQVGETYNSIFADARYVYRHGTDVLGIIDAPQIDKMYMMRGRFAESKLLTRVVNRRVTYTGKVEDVCRALVDEFCINNVEPERNIEHLLLGEYHGLGEEITIQPYKKTVYDAIREVLTSYEMSFRLRYEFTTNNLYFEVYQGLDRTQSQTENEWCVFSRELFTVISETFTRTLDTRNFVYVVRGDEDRNEDERILEIQIDDGRPRAEVWVQDTTTLTEDMTDEEYEAAIWQTGYNKLAEFNISDTGECVVDVTNIPEYGLGDKCTYINSKMRATFELRITGIREVVEPNEVSIRAILGRDQLTESQKLRRAVT